MNNTFPTGNTSGSQTSVADRDLVAPVIDVVEVDEPAVVASAAQQIQITGGPANGTVELARIEGELDTTKSGPDGPFDVDPFEANSSVAAPDVQAVQLDGDGEATVDVTLTKTTGNGDTILGGFNHFIAAAVVDGETGPTSNTAVVRLDPDAGADDGTTLRINSGGGAYTTQDGREFSADQHFDGGGAWPTNGPKASEEIADTDDDLLYQSERSASTDQGAFAYNLPVENGDYVVTLHFAEIYFGASANPKGPVGSDGPGGERVFSVNAEGGDVELVDYDINADVGPSTATTRCFVTNVEDGSLDLDFTASVNRPKVSAIEVLPDDGTGCGDSGGTTGAPVLEPIGDQTVTEGDTLTVDITASGSDTDAAELTFTATDAPAFATFADGGDGTATLTLEPGEGDAGTYDLTVEVSDGTATDSETFTITVEAAGGGGEPLSTVRINAGGNAHTTGAGEEFVADQNFSGGKTYKTADAIGGTDEDPLYKTERYADGAELSYDVPVTNGTYRFVLHFAEIFATSDGARLFDVAIEGDQVLDEYDIHAEVGHDVATTEEFVVPVSDGEATITLTTVEDNAKVSAIEILPADGAYLSASPGSLDFDQVMVDETATQTVTLTHTGSADAGPISGTVTVDGGDFAADTGSISLEAGASQEVAVTFAPSNEGQQSGTLTVTHDGDNSPTTVALSGEGTDETTPVPVNFGKSTLSGEVATNPTSIDTGPDGRVYVSQQDGEIQAYEVTRDGENDYDVTDVEIIDEIQEIPNHNDDGSAAPDKHQGKRQVTGIRMAGTAANPEIYVSSSDPRIAVSNTDPPSSSLDTNSGVISKLTWDGSSWEHVLLVRGLPRSEENHSVNGIALSPDGDTMYLAAGGHTNKGAPSNKFSYIPEYALSAAVLEIDLAALERMQTKTDPTDGVEYTYDLPTLDPSLTVDPSRPFGGVDGDNMAKWVDGPVSVYSPGYRNHYDVVLTEAGELYTVDNGPNTGWGGIPVGDGPGGTCTNEPNENNSTGKQDHLHHITGEGYYGGHPNPTRGNPDGSGYAGAVPQSWANPVECDYQSPNNPNEDGNLATWTKSTNGMDEYTASNFGGAMQGDLLVASFDGDVYRISLNANSTAATTETLGSTGGNPLDVAAQGDDDPLPGVIFVAQHGGDNIFVFEPGDFGGSGGGGQCTGADDAGLDEDGDGYDNADEIDAGTNPCSAADTPADFDGDQTSNVNDPDDDNDGQPDTSDVFAVDADNGTTTAIPASCPDEGGNPPPSTETCYRMSPGSFQDTILSVGFTGLMTNGSSDYQSLYDPDTIIDGGAANVLTVQQTTAGDAYQSDNDQAYAFQFGVNPDTEAFTARTRILDPFPSGTTPQNAQSVGFYLGDGTQDGYVKLVANAKGGQGGIELAKEVGGTFDQVVNPTEAGVKGDGATVDLYLHVPDPTADPVTVEASYTINGGDLVEVGSTTVPAAWFGDSLAVGVISTHNNANEPISASWSVLEVQQDADGPGAGSGGGANTAPELAAIGDQTVDEGASETVDIAASDDDGDPLTLSATDVPAFATFSDDGDGTATLQLDPGSGDAGDYDVTVTADDGTDTDSETFTVTVDETAAAPVTYRVNAGGGEFTTGDGRVFAADSNFTGGKTFTNSDISINGTQDDGLYQSERYFTSSGGYGFEVPSGEYEVTLHFAEIFHGVPGTNGETNGDGDRLFDVAVEGQTVLDDYDIHADVGAATAVTKCYVTTVDDGQANIAFAKVVDAAKVSAIEVEPSDGTGCEDSSSGGGDGTTSSNAATLEVTPNSGNINTSTYGSNSFEVTNDSADGQQIVAVTLDLRTALLPDLVFDPDGTAGDTTAKAFQANSGGAATGFTGSSLPVAHDDGDGSGDGFDVLALTFDDFGPGETFGFSIDNDPTSIKGMSAPGPNDSGSVSGLELAGSTLTIEYADGEQQTSQPFGDGSVGGSKAVVAADAPAAPAIEVLGQTAPATVSEAAQTVRLTGEPGTQVQLMRVEGGLYGDGLHDVDDFEANTAVAVEYYPPVTLDGSGQADVSVVLTRADGDAGLNHFMAGVTDGTHHGPTSPTVVLDYDPSGASGGSASGVFQGQDGSVVMEVESAAPAGDWNEETEFSGYTGSGYYAWRGPNKFNSPGSGVLSYEFSIAEGESGTYQLRIRNRRDKDGRTGDAVANDQENDVWVRMDGGDWIKVFRTGGTGWGSWVWNSEFDFGHGNQPNAAYDLSSGTHTLEVAGRSANFKIDRIHLYTGNNGPSATAPESPRT